MLTRYFFKSGLNVLSTVKSLETMIHTIIQVNQIFRYGFHFVKVPSQHLPEVISGKKMQIRNEDSRTRSRTCVLSQVSRLHNLLPLHLFTRSMRYSTNTKTKICTRGNVDNLKFTFYVIRDCKQPLFNRRVLTWAKPRL